MNYHGVPPPLIWDHVKNGIKNKDMEMNSEIEVIGLLRPPPRIRISMILKSCPFLSKYFG